MFILLPTAAAADFGSCASSCLAHLKLPSVANFLQPRSFPLWISVVVIVVALVVVVVVVDWLTDWLYVQPASQTELVSQSKLAERGLAQLS